MTKRFATGLVVGKFCPLHKGHELLIDTAIRACGKVVVISYTRPGFERCGRAAREQWITGLFPSVLALVVDDPSLRRLCREKGLPWRPLPHNDDAEADHREFVAWLCGSVLGTRVDAVFTSEDYGDGFARSLTELFAARGLGTTEVAHVCVDRGRATVPVSGTLARSDAHAFRHAIDPRVYADLVGRVALLGGESSGKTTLARALAHRFGTAWVPEYGRELWEQREGRLVREDMLEIALQQVERERQLGLHARRFLFCDTTPLTTAFYSEALFGEVDPGLEQLAEREYEHTFLCAPDHAFVQDGTRRDAAFRERQHAWYLRRLQARDIPFTLVSGPVESRVAAVAGMLGTPGSMAGRWPG